MSSPLVERLVENGYPVVDEENIEAFFDGPGIHVLFFAGDPRQHRETDDVAVVLPELVKAFPDLLHPAVVASGAELSLQQRYSFRRWPTLVFERREGYLGEISGIKNWSDYLERIEKLIATRPKPAPGLASARNNVS